VVRRGRHQALSTRIRAKAGQSLTLADRTFHRFKGDLGDILGGNLYDVIIHGSFVLGDFRPHRGDLDYVVVTNRDLDDETDAELFALHDRYRSEKELLLCQLEGTFYPKPVLRDPALPFRGCYIGTTRRGWRGITTFQNSLMDLKVIASSGKHLLGRTVPVFRPTEDQILMELRTDLGKLKRRARSGPDSIGFWMALIHWCARTLCHLDTGSITSKTMACRWCQGRDQLADFRPLFRQAERRRYPYGGRSPTPRQMAACRALLARVSRRLEVGRDSS
jgi:hypothetical protein